MLKYRHQHKGFQVASTAYMIVQLCNGQERNALKYLAALINESGFNYSARHFSVSQNTHADQIVNQDISIE